MTRRIPLEPKQDSPASGTLESLKPEAENRKPFFTSRSTPLVPRVAPASKNRQLPPDPQAGSGSTPPLAAHCPLSSASINWYTGRIALGCPNRTAPFLACFLRQKWGFRRSGGIAPLLRIPPQNPDAQASSCPIHPSLADLDLTMDLSGFRSEIELEASILTQKDDHLPLEAAKITAHSASRGFNQMWDQ
jgi:hypothetical protein